VVARFDSPKRWATGKGPFRDYLGGQTSTATGVAYVESELAECPPSSDRRAMGRGHNEPLVFRYRGLM
jgi:hypothetical protein